MEQREYSTHAYAKRRINIHPQKVQLPVQNGKYNWLAYSTEVLGTTFSQIHWNQIMFSEDVAIETDIQVKQKYI